MAKVRRSLSGRGAVLVTLSALYVGIGASWIWPTAEAAQSQSAVWRDSIAPTWVWGGLWVIVGLMCFAAGSVRCMDYADWGFGPAGGLMLAWCVLEFLGWRFGAIDQGYRPSLIWAGFAYLIYRVARIPEADDGPPEDRGGTA